MKLHSRTTDFDPALYEIHVIPERKDIELKNQDRRYSEAYSHLQMAFERFVKEQKRIDMEEQIPEINDEEPTFDLTEYESNRIEEYKSHVVFPDTHAYFILVMFADEVFYNKRDVEQKRIWKVQYFMQYSPDGNYDNPYQTSMIYDYSKKGMDRISAKILVDHILRHSKKSDVFMLPDNEIKEIMNLDEFRSYTDPYQEDKV